MRSQCGPPKFDEKDWSNFDFSRWHLDDVTKDSAATAFAQASEKLFNSQEWRQNFQTTLEEFQQGALGLFKDHSQNLREQQATVKEDFEKRAAAAKQRSEDLKKSAQAATSPPIVEPDPTMFHAAIRVVSEKDDSLGLPHLGVQILNPQREKEILIEASTNHDGNAVLTVSPELAKELDKTDAALQIVDRAGKPLATLANAVCIRVGQIETRVVKVPESETIAEHAKLALETRAQREVNATRAIGRSEVLTKELQNVIDVLNCRLENNEAIVAELEKPGSAVTEPAEERPAPEEGAGSETEAPARKSRSSSQKRPKKQ
jgi:hypothetical protein